MEAMTLGYPPEQAGQISVTAAKEDWQMLINMLGNQTWHYDQHLLVEKLTHNLLYAGVYE